VHKKTRPYAKDEFITRGTTSIELCCEAQFHLCGHASPTAPLANGEASGQLLIHWRSQVGSTRYPSAGLHYPGSLFGYASVYW